MGGFIAFLLSRATDVSAFAILEAGYLFLSLAGLALVAAFARRDLAGNPDRGRYQLVFLASLPIGLAGARLLPIIQDALAAGRLTYGLLAAGGLVFYTGALAGLCAMYAGCRIMRLSPWPLLDAVCLYLPLGHAFGRLGCFFGGCCFGAPTDSVCGVRFPAGSPAFLQHKSQGLLPDGAVASLPVHPSQLYETAGNLVLFALLLLLSKRRPQLPGRLTAFYLAGYAALRFTLEFWRGDAIRGVYFGLSASQYIALTTLAAVLAVAFGGGKRSVAPVSKSNFPHAR
ncbi:prolipoprotein diacylglyceryl transferase [Solidesulfovibrio magneticus]|uniref:Prolipoprotein diacylglyceryl transferase family protein n=1 Tax=Solidesulfovibrio magneticus (strain ATCC 700980 / DSM 13731 / RS-1) TaxID=573370 RepID=C4XK06_SOLM1|nr:prolipoprotein diacylglyceryl transferase family protein [Solidesulfovibrio magneticus]BAH74361.1 prolipoprotein diacylglyceryl transferase family protein [Solidesulfovibrio magneticus RS-1]